MLDKEQYLKLIEILEAAFNIESTGKREIYEGNGYWGIDVDKGLIFSAKDSDYTEDLEVLKLASTDVVELEDLAIFVLQDGNFITQNGEKYTGVIEGILKEG